MLIFPNVYFNDNNRLLIIEQLSCRVCHQYLTRTAGAKEGLLTWRATCRRGRIVYEQAGRASPVWFHTATTACRQHQRHYWEALNPAATNLRSLHSHHPVTTLPTRSWPLPSSALAPACHAADDVSSYNQYGNIRRTNRRQNGWMPAGTRDKDDLLQTTHVS